jgi:sterol desaturase/sphingolipid hydroxylase (fatty acid hydroxylase superfamily)
LTSAPNPYSFPNVITAIIIATVFLTAIIAARYLALSGLAYWLLWGRPNHLGLSGVRLNRDAPSWRLMRHEIRASLVSSPIYAFPAAIVLVLWQNGGSAIYSDVHRHGWVYLAFSAILYLVLQDTYYYWLHRAIHGRLMFRWCHAGHHRSRQPTPFASFSFDAAEAALTAWFMPALAMLIPINVYALLALLMMMTVTAILNHSGWELIPPSWLRGPFGALMIGASHHSLHHTRFQCNYGLYFRVWDRLMGTDHSPAPPIIAPSAEQVPRSAPSRS